MFEDISLYLIRHIKQNTNAWFCNIDMFYKCVIEIMYD